ncbi:ChrR family anti-sigma-E factor [Enterovibrio norvegicus]|uniref:ChrR family anti-sigma-E factor n=1 Tax=Enterovibrio norvegicus TaxID=188144 RepID=UPI000C816540|nr:ChrR family anti-sigma-E factor [Enterovibrio norvegicus]PML80029.1 transcriptional regulator [Enterovibrio norvegicus]
MIKYHPTDEMLAAHAVGDLAASMSIAVSAHCEMCEHCMNKVALFTEQAAQLAFDVPLPHGGNAVSGNDIAQEEPLDMDAMFGNMLADIMSDEMVPKTLVTPSPKAEISVCGETYSLPIALRRYHQLGWSSIGTISRARLPLNEGDTRASLLHIGMNGSVPSHTHKGTELTLLLGGHFEDENDTYVPGDFIMLDASNHHTPQTHDGCLCYTVSDAPLHFTKGVSQLLNAVGRVIY